MFLYARYYSDIVSGEGVKELMDEGPKRGGPRPRHILLVENELAIALEMEGVIAESGKCKVHLAGSEAAARQVLGEISGISGAILDVGLADGTSLELARELLDQGIPVAFATGYETGTELLAPFPDVPVIGKPFNTAELLTLVDRLLCPRGHNAGSV